MRRTLVLLACLLLLPLGVSAQQQYPEDSIHQNADWLTLAGVVRKDTPGSLCGADGRRCVLQVDSSGALRVTGGGGGVQHQEDNPHASGDVGTFALGVRKDVPSSLAGADGDYTGFIFDSANRLWVTLGTAVSLGPIMPSSGGALTRSTFNITTSGDNTVVAAVGGQITRVYRMKLFPNGANTITIKCASTTVDNATPLADKQGLILDLTSDAWYTCGTNEAFIITTSSTNPVVGFIDRTTN